VAEEKNFRLVEVIRILGDAKADPATVRTIARRFPNLTIAVARALGTGTLAEVLLQIIEERDLPAKTGERSLSGYYGSDHSEKKAEAKPKAKAKVDEDEDEDQPTKPAKAKEKPAKGGKKKTDEEEEDADALLDEDYEKPS
jgi:hypothetical protein